MAARHPLCRCDRILLGGHRGDRVHAPENTLPAMQAALDLGLDVIETDVRMTKDGQLVLMHDRDVARTTNGQGLVDEMTLDEIRALDAGCRMGPAFAGVRVPTVEEFLDLIAGTGVAVNWELKEYPTELGEEHAFTCIRRLVDLIDRYDMADRSILNSFSERDLEFASDTWPGRFAIHGYPRYNKPKDASIKPLESFLDWTVIWNKTEDHPAGFREDYERARAAGILCCIMVPDRPECYREAIELGCRMFTSDDPRQGVAVFRELGLR